MALSKWVDHQLLEKEARVENSNYVSLNLRIDSQDSWVFTPPMREHVVMNSNFYFGLPRCDSRLVFLLEEAGYLVQNPVFAVHAIEMEDTKLRSHLYEVRGQVEGEGKSLFLSSMLTL